MDVRIAYEVPGRDGGAKDARPGRGTPAWTCPRVPLRRARLVTVRTGSVRCPLHRCSLPRAARVRRCGEASPPPNPRHDRLCWLSHKFVGNSLDMPSWKLRKIGTMSL